MRWNAAAIWPRSEVSLFSSVTDGGRPILMSISRRGGPQSSAEPQRAERSLSHLPRTRTPTKAVRLSTTRNCNSPSERFVGCVFFLQTSASSFHSDRSMARLLLISAMVACCAALQPSQLLSTRAQVAGRVSAPVMKRSDYFLRVSRSEAGRPRLCVFRWAFAATCARGWVDSPPSLPV